MHKPHGSFNLYANASHYEFYFVDPEEIPGTYVIPTPAAECDLHLPPSCHIASIRFTDQNPIAARILVGLSDIDPMFVTFWG